TGVILGAWYMLSLVRAVFFGPVKEPHHEGHAIADLNGREIAALVPIAIACVLIGVYSPVFTDVAKPEIKYVASLTEKAVNRRTATAQVKPAATQVAEREKERE